MSTAIVLSGGGAKGDFEVGAVRFLYDHGIRPDIVCGTSVGSINAVKLAEGEPDASGPADGLNAPGLPGLVAIWKSLHTNEDMYVAEDWLNDIDKEIRDALTANYSDPDLPYPGPLVVTDGRNAGYRRRRCDWTKAVPRLWVTVLAVTYLS